MPWVRRLRSVYRLSFLREVHGPALRKSSCTEDWNSWKWATIWMNILLTHIICSSFNCARGILLWWLQNIANSWDTMEMSCVPWVWSLRGVSFFECASEWASNTQDWESGGRGRPWRWSECLSWDERKLLMSVAGIQREWRYGVVEPTCLYKVWCQGAYQQSAETWKAYLGEKAEITVTIPNALLGYGVNIPFFIIKK